MNWKPLLAALTLAGSLLAQKHAITHEDLWLMKRVGEPVVSPDGKWIVVAVVEPDYDPAKQSSDLWLLPSDGSAAPRRITFTKGAESGAVWSPDGTRLAFTAKREGDDAPQIYILPLQGGEAQRVTSAPAGASSPKWRPDGQALLYESDVDPVADRKSRKWSARVYDTFPIRYWNVWLDEKRPHVFVQPLPGGAARDLFAGTQFLSSGFGGVFSATGGQELQAVWTPDGQGVVFTATVNRDDLMNAEAETHLFLVPAAGGEPRRFTEPGQSFGNPEFSPAGALYALHQKNPVKGGRLYSLTRLVRFDWPNPAKPAFLHGAWDRSIGAFSFSNDGKTLYFDAENSGFDTLFTTSATGGAPKALFEVTRGGYTGVRPVAGGLIARFQTSSQPPEVVLLDPASAKHRFLTSFNAERVAAIETTEPVHFWFTASNGKRIHNLMILPPFFDKTKRYPIVIFPHGGPNSMSKDAFSTRWNNHFLASPGYVILETNYTGSTGFGEQFADDIERDVLRGPAQEILEAIEDAAKRYPFIDKSRQAAAGASYGGYLMNWFNGHTNQFKCLVNHAGAVNNESQYGSNDGGLSRELRMGGPIWEKGGQWNDQSPIRYSGAFKTPTLITQGELDFRVPLSESMTTFKLLQRLKVPTRLVLYPDEGHWILKGENSRHHMNEILGWLKKYL
ncbi:MAG: S9 family peptidase [Acidobacteria bacterium]|nr:S9 family peptidase [Acidobacteriota bacterium]